MLKNQSSLCDVPFNSRRLLQTVVAERTSYSTVDGSVLPDGKMRKVSTTGS